MQSLITESFLSEPWRLLLGMTCSKFFRLLHRVHPRARLLEELSRGIGSSGSYSLLIMFQNEGWWINSFEIVEEALRYGRILLLEKFKPIPILENGRARFHITSKVFPNFVEINLESLWVYVGESGSEGPPNSL